jgi:aspartate-semialdehyde dehydrogenase
MSEELANLTVRECKASNFTDCELVFSGLDSDVAGDVGMTGCCPGLFSCR